MLPAAVRCSGRPSRWQPLLRAAAGVIQAPPTTGLQARLCRSLANLQPLVPLTSHPRPGLADLGGTLSLSRPAPVQPRRRRDPDPSTILLLRPLLVPFPGGSAFSSPLPSSPSSYLSPPQSLLFLFSLTSPAYLCASTFPCSALVSRPQHLHCSSQILESLDHPRPPGQQAELHPEVFKNAPRFCPMPGSLLGLAEG